MNTHTCSTPPISRSGLTASSRAGREIGTRTGTRTGAALCASAMALVGAPVAVAPLLSAFPVLLGQALRYAAAALILLAGMTAVGKQLVRPTRTELCWLSAIAAVGLAGFNVALLMALRYAQPTLVASIVGASPLVLAIVTPLVTRIRPTTAVVVGATVVALGVGLSQGGGAGSLPGIALAVLAMTCEVGFTVLAAPVLKRLGAFTVATSGCALAVPLLLGAAYLTGSATWRMPTGREFGALAWLALVTTAIAFVLWYEGVARLGSARAGLFAGCIPFGALAAAAVIGGVAATGVALTGAASSSAASSGGAFSGGAFSGTVVGGAVLSGLGIAIGLGVTTRRHTSGRPGGSAEAASTEAASTEAASTDAPSPAGAQS